MAQPYVTANGIRELRRVRGMTLRTLASRSGIAKATLERWEGKAVEPHMPPLIAVMDALDATPEERLQVLCGFNSPRAVRALQEYAVSGTRLDAAPPWLPTSGDVWRELRLRAGMTAGELARTVGEPPSSVTRWEQSVVYPPGDLLPRLFHVLCALPEEREMLLLRRFHLAESDPEALPWEEWNGRIHALGVRAAFGKQPFPAGLCFSLLEGHLWAKAMCHGVYALLLARVYCWRAEYLLQRGRYAEIAPYARRALDTAKPVLEQDPANRYAKDVWFVAERHQARSKTHRPDRRYPWAGYRHQEAMREYIIEREYPNLYSQTLREIATFAAEGGNPGLGLRLVTAAQQVAEHAGWPEYVEGAVIARARIHVLTGDGVAALDALQNGWSNFRSPNAYHQLTLAAALLQSGERDAGMEHLAYFYRLCAQNAQPHLHVEAEKLLGSLLTPALMEEVRASAVESDQEAA